MWPHIVITCQNNTGKLKAKDAADLLAAALCDGLDRALLHVANKPEGGRWKAEVTW